MPACIGHQYAACERGTVLLRSLQFSCSSRYSSCVSYDGQVFSAFSQSWLTAAASNVQVQAEGDSAILC